MKEVLKIENLTKTYIKSKRKFCVLNNVNYNFNSNTFYCINGKSGAGKTTLIEILGLLKNYENGKLIINGKDTSELSEKEKAIIRNQKIGFVFQSFYLIPTMTALENVMLPLYVNKKINKKEIKPIIYNHYEKITYANNKRKSYSINKYTSNLTESINLCETKYVSDDEIYKDCKYKLDKYYIADIDFFGNDLINDSNSLVVIVPYNYFGDLTDFNDGEETGNLFKLDDDKNLQSNLDELEQKYGISYNYNNLKEGFRLTRNLIFCVKLLVYGFVVLVTLIGVTSVFNTINTSIHLRRKEFAMLRSVGLSSHGFNKILLFESLFFGLKSLIYSLPVSLGIIYLLYLSFMNMTDYDRILIPYKSILIAVIGVFIIILISTIYATRKIRHENILEAIREENI